MTPEPRVRHHHHTDGKSINVQFHGSHGADHHYHMAYDNAVQPTCLDVDCEFHALDGWGENR